MKKSSVQILFGASLLLVKSVLLMPEIASAQGAVGFLTTSHTTVTSGDPASWMENGADWVNPYPTGLGSDGYIYALPNFTQRISVESWRTGSDLKMHFTIPDITIDRVAQPPDVPNGGLPLILGDKIVVFLDPHNSGHRANPSTTINGNADPYFRYEVTMNKNGIDAGNTGVCLPQNFQGGPDWYWGLLVPKAIATCTYNQGQYEVELTIHLADIGSPASDIGVAYAILNDLGHAHDVVTYDSQGHRTDTWVTDDVGTAFPSCMGLDEYANDPLATSVNMKQAGGTWTNPSQWGIGYFNLSSVITNISFSHNPDYCWSNALKLSECDAQAWNDVGAVTAPWENQEPLAKWYRYYPVQPCKMRVWIKVNKSGSSVVSGRLLVLWAAPSIAPQSWYVVALTDPISFGDSEGFVHVDWGNVPPVNLTGHACIRVYALPGTLLPTFDQAAINGIDTDTKLNQFESAYGFQPNDQKSAQMNFTNLFTGSCPNGSPCAYLSADKSMTLASIGNLDDLALPSPTRPSSGSAIDTTKASRAAVITQPGGDKKVGVVRVQIEAFAIPMMAKRPNHTYLKKIGGMGWAMLSTQLEKVGSQTLTFDVSNPAVARRDYSVKPPKSMAPLPVEILIFARADATPGIPTPTVQITYVEKKVLQPGETGHVTAVVTPGAFPRYILALLAGISLPQGNFGNAVDPGFAGTLSFEYRINPSISALAAYTHHQFKSKLAGASDIGVNQFSVQAKYYLPTNLPFDVFAHAGASNYAFNPGTSKVGFNVGVGAQYALSTSFGLVATYNYNSISSSGTTTTFSSIQGGIYFAF